MERAGELIESILTDARALSATDLSGAAPQDLGALLVAVERARAAVDAAANSVLDRFDADGAAAHDGLRTTSAWLRQRCQMTGASAARRVRTTRALRHLPEVADGFRSGRFSADQADLFARNHHPRTAEAMAEDESVLAALADRLRPDDFGRELRGWAEMVDTDGAEPDPGHRGRGFSFVQTLDDTWTGRLDLSAADGLFLHGAVEAMAEVLFRTQEGGDPTAVDGDVPRPDDGSGPIGGATTGGTRSRCQRRADALLELVRRGCGRAAVADDQRPDVPDLGRPGGRRSTAPRVTLYLTLDAGDLEAGRGADTLAGHHLGSAATDRLLCDAAVTWVLMDPTGGPQLDFGRRRRLVSPAQRSALALRDRGCSFPGCTAAPDECDAHHIVHWRRGGRTDLNNLTLACFHHHALAHEEGWAVVMTDLGPRWARPDGVPLGRRPGWDTGPPGASPPEDAPVHWRPRPSGRAPVVDLGHGQDSDAPETARLARERAHALRWAA